MQHDIPVIVEQLFHYFITPPDPCLWPDYLKGEPIQGHGLWSFYQGLCLGMQITDTCLEKV